MSDIKGNDNINSTIKNPNNAEKIKNGNANKDRPWIFRTYAGHSTAKNSNKLFRNNLKKGQTGLSVAFDLPTQTGYDADHKISKGEVGRVGVSISHIGDIRELFDKIPLDQMNTSLTINATAAWLLSLYIALADERGIDRAKLSGTTQNDIIKEYLSRGTYIFPPSPSVKILSDIVTFSYKEMPLWNPTNICSYHLQEAGATPEQELAFALATAITLLDKLKASKVISDEDFPRLVGRISFFVNAGMRFITEICKMRAFTELWDDICLKRYKVDEEKYRRFRYGVQVNSLGLTEQQPENNVYRILIEMLAVTLSKNARARAVQLPAWNEALGLPRPFDQQWSIRMQQILAYETDLLEFQDIFVNNPEIEKKVKKLKKMALKEIANIEKMGGVIKAVDNGYMKQQLVLSNARRMVAMESGEQVVVGVNRWVESEPSPLIDSDGGGFLTISPEVEVERIKNLDNWRKKRDNDKVKEALSELSMACKKGENIMEPSIKAAKTGVTTGEWSQILRNEYGDYRAPTGININTSNIQSDTILRIRDKVDALSEKLGKRVKILVGKPGLDGHSNGAEQVALRAYDCGMEVVYEGIRLSPINIVETAIKEGAHIIGLSILSGTHVSLMAEIMALLKENNAEDILVIAGGIIPDADAQQLRKMGVNSVYTPKNYQLDDILEEIIDDLEIKSSLEKIF